tara:strand:- start:707 stop:1294 length:588 start_codon:yes stop_codon:yes gene_type:complete
MSFLYDGASTEPMAGGSTMKNILIILVCLSTTDLLGQEYDVAPADQLGMLDENLFGVWETTEDVAILRMHLRPDGIGVWNGDVFGNQSIYHIWVSRYGVADGRLLMGRATNYYNDEPGGPWIKEGFDEHLENDEAESVAYEINDGKLIMSPQGEESIVWTKSTEQIIVPNAVTLFDGYTSVDSHSWGAVKVVSNR